jgi:hypothetical protein
MWSEWVEHAKEVTAPRILPLNRTKKNKYLPWDLPWVMSTRLWSPGWSKRGLGVLLDGKQSLWDNFPKKSTIGDLAADPEKFVKIAFNTRDLAIRGKRYNALVLHFLTIWDIDRAVYCWRASNYDSFYSRIWAKALFDHFIKKWDVEKAGIWLYSMDAKNWQLALKQLIKAWFNTKTIAHQGLIEASKKMWELDGWVGKNM